MVSTVEIPDEPETDDPTSSSENESLSNSDSDDDRHATSTISQARAPVSNVIKYRASTSSWDGTAIGQSRRVLRARQANLDAWLYVSTLMGPGGATTPWEGLLQTMPEIHRSTNDPKVVQCSALGRSTSMCHFGRSRSAEAYPRRRLTCFSRAVVSHPSSLDVPN